LARVGLGKAAHLLDVVEEFPAACILDNHYELFLLDKGMIQLDDVFVSQLFQILGLFENSLHLIRGLN
jgi:hypothetical protein